MKNNAVRSPLFYVGDKYKIINEIKAFFPDRINRFIEPFVGGGSVFMNVKANEYLLNDIDENVIAIHRMLSDYAYKTDSFYQNIDEVVKRYGLSCSYMEDIVPLELREKYEKTYYARFNKNGYERLREDYNHSEERSAFLLYLLVIYGFNRMIRFNKAGDFNLPVGNVDLNHNTIKALNDYFEQIKIKNPQWYNCDFEDFIVNIDLGQGDLIYVDPPYLITFSEYNKHWNEAAERRLLNLLDELNENNINFAISNVTYYKNKVNQLFLDWSEQYNSYTIKSNYISYHDNTNKIITEVLVTNY